MIARFKHFPQAAYDGGGRRTVTLHVLDHWSFGNAACTAAA